MTIRLDSEKMLWMSVLIPGIIEFLAGMVQVLVDVVRDLRGMRGEDPIL